MAFRSVLFTLGRDRSVLSGVRSWVVILAVSGVLGGIWGLTHFRNRALRDQVYRVGVDHAPPYNVLRPGQAPDGLAVEALRLAAKRAGIQIEFVPLHIRVEDAFQRNLVDLWPAVTVTPERGRWLHLTRPWLTNRLSVVSKTSAGIHKPQDLAGKKVALLRNQILKELLGDIEPAPIPKIDEDRHHSLVALCRNEVDASILESRFLEQALLARPPECRNIEFSLFSARGLERRLAIASRGDLAEIADELRDQIAGMNDDGSLASLVDRWTALTSDEFRYATNLARAEDRTRYFLVLLIGTLVAGIVLFWQNRKLRGASEVAQRAIQQKSEFLASITHEIRTPLHGIIGMADQLADTPLTPAQRQQAHTIRDAGRSLARILRDLLDATRADAGKITFDTKAFDPGELARSVFALGSAEADQKGLDAKLKLSPGLPSFVLGDALRIGQVLNNLLSNAVKYTDSGSVTMEASVQDRRPGFVTLRFDISDTGMGIPEDRLPLLFQRYYRAGREGLGGAGLGLSICHQFVMLMGGAIQVRTKVGRGSTFSVSVPLPEISVIREGAQPRAVRQRPLRVLVVDDHPVNRRIARAVLRKLGCEVTLVESGEKAVAQAADGYDLIFMDCKMPGMDGYEASRSIRDSGGPHANTPIVAMTAGSYEEERERREKAGMTCYVGKPYDIAEVGRVLQSCCPAEAEPPVAS